MTNAMQGTAVSPASGQPPKQVVLLLHGVGADANDLIGLAPAFQDILPDAVFVSPNAPFPCDMAPMGRQWFSLQTREPSAMLEGIHDARPLLNAYIDETLEQHGCLISDLIVLGFSQGTMMALHTLPYRAQACAAILGFSGAMIDSTAQAKHVTCKPPVCLIHGNADEVVPFAAMDDARQSLSAAGLTVETSAQHGLGHGINSEGIEVAKGFLRRTYLARGAA